MTISFNDLEDAFLWASVDFVDTEAWINRVTGQIYYVGDDSIPEQGEPVDLHSGNWVKVPHKNLLDLGSNLVFEFAETLPSDQYDEIRFIFRRKGAYRRFRNYLVAIGQLDNWHTFEAKITKTRLLSWAEQNQIQVSVE
ncbi:MAG: UPF0158 family protein [Ardenticatenaceae bacterium]|nr:UPF0158 family protein [Ardenticatenaceae bacterium]